MPGCVNMVVVETSGSIWVLNNHSLGWWCSDINDLAAIDVGLYFDYVEIGFGCVHQLLVPGFVIVNVLSGGDVLCLITIADIVESNTWCWLRIGWSRCYVWSVRFDVVQVQVPVVVWLVDLDILVIVGVVFFSLSGSFCCRSGSRGSSWGDNWCGSWGCCWSCCRCGWCTWSYRCYGSYRSWRCHRSIFSIFSSICVIVFLRVPVSIIDRLTLCLYFHICRCHLSIAFRWVKLDPASIRVDTICVEQVRWVVEFLVSIIIVVAFW